MGDFAILKSPQAMRKWAKVRKAQSKRLVLVATMGALHDGHLSLLRVAEKNGDDVIVSIYVNPTQFGLNEDFDHYPRRLSADLKTLRQSGVSIAAVYVPETRHMYPDGFMSEMSLPSLSKHLCGKSRPHYFGGVAMVVAKLLHQTCADVAVFGEKDYQQLAVIRRMALDLDFPVKILAAATLRDVDGLALSSRNVYLTDEERQVAPLMYKVLCRCRDEIKAGGVVSEVLTKGRRALLRGGFSKVDYLSLVRADDLVIVGEVAVGVKYRLLSAAYLGGARLIDNIRLEMR